MTLGGMPVLPKSAAVGLKFAQPSEARFGEGGVASGSNTAASETRSAGMAICAGSASTTHPVP